MRCVQYDCGSVRQEKRFLSLPFSSIQYEMKVLMSQSDESTNRIRSALNRIYEQQPPYFQEYLTRYKQDPKSRIFAPLAEAYRKQGDVEEAIAICLQGLNHHPDFSGGRVTLAKCYLDKNQLELAKRELDYVVDRVPENLMAHKLLGEVFLREGDKVEALRAYKMALIQSPNDIELAKLVTQLERETVTGNSPSAQTDAESEWAIPEPTFDSENTALASGIDISHPEAESSVELVPNVTSDGRIEMVPFDPQDYEDHVDRILGVEEEEGDTEPFQVEHVSHLFEQKEDRAEITTSTLGDLYFAQGQYDKALRIFERVASEYATESIVAKVDACRRKLGVMNAPPQTQRKIEKLQGILARVKNPT